MSFLKKANVNHKACIFCFYSSDVLINKDEVICKENVRKSPSEISLSNRALFSKVIHCQTISIDNEKKFCYLPLGYSKGYTRSQYYIKVNIKWPNEYTLITWIRFQSKGSLFTTFDSDYNAPIFAESNELGVHTIEGSARIPSNKFKFEVGRWYFITVFGSKNKSIFYIGNTKNEPKKIYELDKSICGQETWRIGNDDGQGPGDFGCGIILNYHLNDLNDVKKYYWETKNEMEKRWNNDEIQKVKGFLMKYGLIKGIVGIILDYIRYYTF